MICKNCGENLPDSARVCDTCGASVKRSAPVVAEEGVSAPAPKNSVSVTEFFGSIFGDKKYRLLIVLLSVLSLFSLIQTILAVFSADWSSLIASAINTVLYLMLIIPAWNLYFNAPLYQNARDFLASFKTFRIYTIVFIIAQVVSVVAVGWVFLLIAGAVSVSAFFEELFGVVGLGFIVVLPAYLAYGFVDSLHRSAVNDRVELKQIGAFSVVQVVFGVVLLIGFVLNLFTMVTALSHGEYEAFMSSISSLVQMLIYFCTYDWLRSVRKKQELM